MRDRFPLIVVAGLVLLAVLGSFLFRGGARGSFADKLSTYRSEKDGARGAYLLASESGLPLSRFKRDLRVIEEKTNLVLLAVEFEETTFLDKPKTSFWFAPDAGTDDQDDALAEEDEALHTGLNRFHAKQVDKDEREKLLEHIRKGATVVYVPWGAQNNPLLKALGVFVNTAEKELEMRTLVPAQPTPYTLGVERVESRVQSYLDLPQDAVPLLLDEKLGAVVAGAVPYGQGQLIVIGAPELAMNQALSRADNAQLWLSMLSAVSATGPIAFDEFHHGFTSDRSVAEFASHYGLHFAALQLILGLCLWAGALRRFGRPRPPPEDIRVGATDALYAASRLYREGKHHTFAASLICRGLAQELASQAGLPWKATPPEIAAGLAARGRKDLADALAEVMSQANVAVNDGDVQRVAGRAATARLLVRIKRRGARGLSIYPAAAPPNPAPSKGPSK
jgi:hypothetical protein